MRVLLLANIDVGLYKFRRELIEALVKEHEVFFCVPNGEFVKEIECIGGRFVECKELDRRSSNPIKDIKLLYHYQGVIKRIRPDVVLTYTIKPNVYGGLICGLMKVPHIANITGLGTAIENGGLLAMISTTLYKIGLRKAKCVFFQNKDNQEFFNERGIIKGKSRLIPGSGVNLSNYNLEPYPSDDNGIRFLFVGRIMKDKGIEELLFAIREIHRENSSVVLDVVGFSDEDYTRDLAVAENEGAIITHGFQSNVRPFYELCHCTVLPSYHEGMANVMLEASATGRPVITSNIPGCKETFDEGVTGFGCTAGDKESLKSAMLRFTQLSQRQRENMGIAARAKMEREFDRQLVINAYREEIETI